MKRITLNNMNKAKKLIMQKGYSIKESENIALNCFAMAQSFGDNVEYYINKLSNKEENKHE